MPGLLNLVTLEKLFSFWGPPQIKLMRLDGISSIEEGNAYLRGNIITNLVEYL